MFNETNPKLFDYWFQEFDLPVCGTNPTFNQEGCCIESIDVEESFGFTSALYSFNDPIDWPEFPNTTYCVYQQPTETFYVMQNEVCQLGLQCFNNGTLAVYADHLCTNFTSLQTIPVISVIGKGLEIRWTAVVPSSILIPRMKYTSEWIGIFSISISLILATTITVYYFFTMGTIPDSFRSENAIDCLCNHETLLLGDYVSYYA
jgi:hypothetical protein